MSRGRRRGACPNKKVAQFGVDVLGAPVDQELDILDDFQHRAARFQRLL